MDYVLYPHNQTFAIVKQIIMDSDPIGLVVDGEPDDEYDMEIEQIIIAIQGLNDRNLAADRIRKIFTDAFSEAIAGSPQRYIQIADGIFNYSPNGIPRRGHFKIFVETFIHRFLR